MMRWGEADRNLLSKKCIFSHIESDFLSTLPGLWEHCVKGNVALMCLFGVPFFIPNFPFIKFQQVHPWLIKYFFIVKSHFTLK